MTLDGCSDTQARGVLACLLQLSVTHIGVLGAGGPGHPYEKQTWPARVRFSDYVRSCCYFGDGGTRLQSTRFSSGAVHLPSSAASFGQ
jgi:hypothetical protein